MTQNTTLYSNNARAILTSNISNVATILPVSTVAGFPNISTGIQEFYVTLDDGVHVEIVKVRGATGSSFINCLRGQEGTFATSFLAATPVENRLTAGNITQFARLEDRLFDVASIENLPAPGSINGNSRLCASQDPSGSPILAVVNGTKWKFVNYPDVILVSTISGTITPTSITVTGIGNQLIDTTPNVYVIQFTSGPNLGYCRFAVISTNNISWGNPLFVTPSPGDSYEVYRSLSAWKNATGGSSDRIFFENDIQIWSSYNIPVGRNATSAGPVNINVGATVSVPSGSSWSIV
jgi:hypothetical protein